MTKVSDADTIDRIIGEIREDNEHLAGMPTELADDFACDKILILVD